MVEPITINIRHLSQDVRLPQEQVQAAVDLLDAGFSVPFIARYRKEVTKNLDEENLRLIAEELRDARNLCERKQTILKTIESAGKLTPELDKSIRDAKSVKRLEDIYLPYKPKKQNPAVTAKENGLEPFALEIIEGKLPLDKVDERAADFINEDKNIKSVASVLLGSGHIIADIFACKAEIIYKVRDILYQHGQLTTTKIKRAGDEKETADTGYRQQTADDSRDEAIAGGAETESINGEETIEDFVSEFTEDVSEVENSEESQAEEASADETSGTESDAATEESPPPSPDQEVTELFEQIKEAQAEKGTPKVISQNTLKKKKRAAAKKKLDEIKQRQRNHFERQFTEYFDYSTKLRGIPAHRILAFDRGEKHKIIQISFKIDEAKVLETVKEICVPQDHVHAEFLTGCLQDAIHRSILPMLYREIRHDMTDYAEKNAVKKFGQNLRYMMLQRPFPNKRVLALDPGGKNGCIAAALDEFGNLIGNETVFIAQSAERRDATTAALAEMVRKYSISAIAIGIGGGSRLTEEAVAHMIETHFADTGLSYIMVNKTGVIAYSTGQIGKEELPNVDSFVRAAVSLGRRLQNPINELVKVEPANLGLGMFLHDIRGKHIKQMLDEIVESCVNLVGVELNSATSAMLTHVAGLNLMTARRICEYRREHGSFRTRDDLRKVPGINEAVYTHAAGFLRITGGDNPLDATNIHPESYELAANILEKLGFAVKDLRNTEKAKAVADKIVSERIGELTVKFSAALNAGLHTVRDILDNFMKPGRDPRNSQPPLTFRKAMMKIENLTPGIELTCTVLNVTEFGAFVDIGLHESGFIHISQMASGYIQSAHDRVFSGDVVRVWVVETDVAKQRVSLSLLPPGTEKQTPGQKPAGGEKERTRAPKEHISRPPRDSRDSRDSKRFDRKPSFDRSPKTFITSPVKKDVKPITEGMKQGKEPMRSFSDLAQLFGRTSPDESEAGKSKK